MGNVQEVEGKLQAWVSDVEAVEMALSSVFGVMVRSLLLLVCRRL